MAYNVDIVAITRSESRVSRGKQSIYTPGYKLFTKCYELAGIYYDCEWGTSWDICMYIYNQHYEIGVTEMVDTPM